MSAAEVSECVCVCVCGGVSECTLILLGKKKRKNFLRFTISAFLFFNERPLSCKIEMQIHLDGAEGATLKN